MSATFGGTDIDSTGGSTTVIADGASYDLTTTTGTDIHGKSDSFRYLSKDAIGNFDVVVRVDGLSIGDADFEAGLMARADLAQGAKTVMSSITAGHGFHFVYRNSTDAADSITSTSSSKFPAYLRLSRSGDTFTAYRSSDGATWKQTGQKTIAMGSTIQLGMAVAGDEGEANTAQFRDYSDFGMSPTPTPTPPATNETTIQWANGVNAPYGSDEGMSIRVGDKLFYMGGFINNDHDTTNQAWVQDIPTGKWTRVADLPLTQTHSGVATDGKSIWLAGGIVGTKASGTTAKCFRYDIAANKWESFTALPEIHMAGQLVYLNGQLHWFGGTLSDRNTLSAKHYVISVDADGKAASAWTPKADMINPGDHFASVVYDGKIYAVGGEHDHTESYQPHDFFSVYDPATDQWTSLPPLLEKASHMEASTLIINGRLVVLGGQGINQTNLKTVQVFDFSTNTWSKITSLPSGRKGGTAYLYNGQIYFIAGRGTNSSGSKENFITSWVGTLSNPW